MIRSLAIILTCVALLGCNRKEARVDPPVPVELVVFHAGSLSAPMQRIAERYVAEHPQIRVSLQTAGSRTCARMISELKKPCDLFISADYTVIDELLIPDHADWHVKTTGNEMVIAYTPKANSANEITADNWYRILARDSVKMGRSSPDSDPCGYRAVLVMNLAALHYDDKTIPASLLAKDSRYIRPKASDLVTLLETHTIDYAFLYASVARQCGLKMVNLPDDVNLKDPGLAQHYRRASVTVSGKAPGDAILKTGEPIVYGLTIPKSARHRPEAIGFARFVLSENGGMAVFEAMGLPSRVPSPTPGFEKLPWELQPFARPSHSSTHPEDDAP